jgi:putative hydroxymethylpyrimidine transport system substrate-binding protein
MSSVRIKLAMAAVSGAMLVTACSGSSSPSPAPSAPQSAAGSSAAGGSPSQSSSPAASRSWTGLLKMNVVEDWSYGGPPWQIWLYPDAQGWYKDAGLDINWVIPPNPSDQPKFIATGQADMGFTYTPDTLIAESTGLDYAAVASLIGVPSENLTCRADAGITDPKSLEGKKVAEYDSPLPQVQFKIFANAQGVDLTKVKAVSAGDNGYPIMIAKQADCTQAGVFEPDTYQADTGKAAVTFYYTKWGLPDWYWEIIGANRKFAEQHPDAVQAFVDVTLRGYAWAKANVQDGVNFIYTKFPETKPKSGTDYNVTAMQHMFDRQKDYVAGKPAGYMDTGIWQTFADLMQSNGVIPQKLDVTKFVTMDYLPTGSSSSASPSP